MDTINNRIKDVINKFYDGNATAFARIVNVGPSTIHSIIGKKQSIPTFTVISSIYEALYKEGLSAHWLLTGEGQMIKENIIKGKVNDLGLFLYKRGKVAPEAMDNLIKSLEEEIKELKEDIKMKDTTISKRDELINTLFGEMTKLVKGEK